MSERKIWMKIQKYWKKKFGGGLPNCMGYIPVKRRRFTCFSSCVFGWVMPHTWMSRPHVWMSHVTNSGHEPTCVCFSSSLYPPSLLLAHSLSISLSLSPSLSLSLFLSVCVCLALSIVNVLLSPLSLSPLLSLSLSLSPCVALLCAFVCAFLFGICVRMYEHACVCVCK